MGADILSALPSVGVGRCQELFISVLVNSALGRVFLFSSFSPTVGADFLSALPSVGVGRCQELFISVFV